MYSQKTISRRQGEKLAEQRRQAEQQVSARQQRRRVLFAALGIFFLGALFALVLLFISVGTEQEPTAPSTSVNSNQRLLQGIEQRGLTLGSPSAPQTVVEFADLHCPYCAVLAAGGIKELIAGPVRQGKVQLQFRPWVVIPGSERSAAAAYAAAEQGRGWQFIKNFYGQQQQLLENSSPIPWTELRQVAADSGVKDLARWQRDASDQQRWQQQLVAIDQQANDLDLGGTPAIAISSGQQLTASDLDYQATIEDFRQALAASPGS